MAALLVESFGSLVPYILSGPLGPAGSSLWGQCGHGTSPFGSPVQREAVQLVQYIVWDIIYGLNTHAFVKVGAPFHQVRLTHMNLEKTCLIDWFIVHIQLWRRVTMHQAVKQQHLGAKRHRPEHPSRTQCSNPTLPRTRQVILKHVETTFEVKKVI